MSNKGLKPLYILLAVLLMVLVVYLGFALRQPAQPDPILELEECPPRPEYVTGFAVRNYYAGTGRITFDATEDMATATEEFGKLSYDLDGGYTLYVNARYDFAEVLAYLESWNECHDTFLVDSQDNLTLPPEAHLDMLTPTQEVYLSIEDDSEILLTVDPTVFEEWGYWTIFPKVDWTFEIDWPYAILVTDALSQTHTIAGPVMARFGLDTPTPTSVVTPTSTPTPREGCRFGYTTLICPGIPWHPPSTAALTATLTPTPIATTIPTSTPRTMSFVKITPRPIQSDAEFVERLIQLADLVELEAKTIGAALDAAWWFIHPVQPVAPEYAHEERQCWHVRELDGKTVDWERFETWRCEERLAPQICEGELCFDPERKQTIWEFRFENEELGALSLRY